MRILYNILRLIRPRQWIKNLAIFAAITFSGELFNIPVLTNVALGFLVLCAVSSATYIVNDFFDIKSDRLHPFKKGRPLAHKDVPVSLALLLAGLLIFASFYLALKVTTAFLIVIIIYLFLI